VSRNILPTRAALGNGSRPGKGGRGPRRATPGTPRGVRVGRPARRHQGLLDRGGTGERRRAVVAAGAARNGAHQLSRIAGCTGASRDILTDRSRKPGNAGVIERRRYCEHPPHYEYHLTQAAHDLFPAMPALREWGDKSAVSTPPLIFQHTCGHPAVTESRCRHCDEPVTRESLTALPSRTVCGSRGPNDSRARRREPVA
jgi:DNA-binding HxlR family transcriptional regulator